MTEPPHRRVSDQMIEVDATRRTRLANERTYLAWWRTGLTALAVSLAAGKVVPELTSGTRWPYELVGAGFALLGVVCVAYGYARERQVDEALRRGEFAPPDRRMTLALTCLGVLLGSVTLLLITFGGH